MSLKAGIVGLPNVGKSTLFNALTNSKVEAGNYLYATITPNVAMVKVPDERLDKLEEIFEPKKKTATAFEFIDIAGLPKGASKGEGLGNQFLAHIREADAICHLVRCFEDENIDYSEEGIDPVRDCEIVNLELVLADLQVVENRLNKLEKKVKANDVVAKKEFTILSKINEALNKGEQASTLDFNQEELNIVKSFNLLTLKPVIYVANMAEKDISNYQDNIHYQSLSKFASLSNCQIVALCAKLEEELISFEEETKEELLKEWNLKESGLDKMIQAAYATLGLCTFFTAGKPEVRAWTFKKGMKAPECAGIIHSDFTRGFIRAETYTFDDLMIYGSEVAVKEKGLLRSEGKEYLVQDGDIMHFLFNV